MDSRVKGLRVANITLERKGRFYAAHRNTAIEDKCAALHGHTYTVRWHCRMPAVHEQSGVTMLFQELEDKLAPVLAELDHSVLVGEDDRDLLLAMKALPGPIPQKVYRVPYGQTSAECLAMHLHERAREAGLNCVQVDVQETGSTTVTYRPAGATA